MKGFGLPVVLLLVVGTLGWLGWNAMEAYMEAGRRMQCSNNVKWIGLTMHNYHDVYAKLPPGYVTDETGKPMHSWRVLLLPYLGEKPLFDRYNFDEPWDSEGNLAVAQSMPEVYRCPSAPGGEANLTHYVVILSDADEDGQANSVFGGNWNRSLASVSDGTSGTLMVVEVKDAVPWTKPDADLHYDTMDFQVGAGQNSIWQPSFDRGGAGCNV